MVLPVKPEVIVSLKRKIVPDEVIEVINTLIAENFNKGKAIVCQDSILERLTEKGLERNEIYNNDWLDVEDLYSEAGWKVVYNKPGKNESRIAFFEFSLK